MTLLSDVLYLFQSSSGLALLSLPHVFIHFGTTMTIGLLTFYTSMEIGSMLIQLELCQYVPKHCAAYSVLLNQIEPDLVFIFDFIVAIKNLGICIMEISLIGKLLKHLIINILNWDINLATEPQTLFILFFTFTITLPLCLTKRIKLIKYSNQIVFIFMLLIFLTLPLNITMIQGTNDRETILTTNNIHNGNNDTVKVTKFESNFSLSAIILFIVSSHKSIFTIFNEKYSTHKYSCKVIFSYTLLIYVICLIYGYLGNKLYLNYFPKKYKKSLNFLTIPFPYVFTSNNTNNNIYKIINLIMTVSLTFGTFFLIPLTLCPFRAAIYHLLNSYYDNPEIDSMQNRSSTGTLNNPSESTTKTYRSITTNTTATFYKTDATVQDTDINVGETTPLLTLEGRRISNEEMIEEGYIECLRRSVQDMTYDPRFKITTTTILILGSLLSSFCFKTLMKITVLLGSTISVIYTFILPGVMGKYYFSSNHWKSLYENDIIANKRRFNLVSSFSYIVLGIILSSLYLYFFFASNNKIDHLE